MVLNCDHLNVSFPGSVNKAEWVSREEQSACVGSVLRMPPRRLKYPFESCVKLAEKGSCCYPATICVPTKSFAYLLCGSGVITEPTAPSGFSGVAHVLPPKESTPPHLNPTLRLDDRSP